MGGRWDLKAEKPGQNGNPNRYTFEHSETKEVSTHMGFNEGQARGMLPAPRRSASYSYGDPDQHSESA